MKEIVIYIAGKPFSFTIRDKDMDISEIVEELRNKHIPYCVRDWFFKERQKFVVTPNGDYVRLD